MPNWCDNVMTITGPADDVERLKNSVKGEDQSPFSLQSIHPIPPHDLDSRERRIIEWGTELDPAPDVQENDFPDGVQYCYKTAWAPIGYEMLLLLSGRFPSLKFIMEHQETSSDVQRNFTIEGGKFTEYWIRGIRHSEPFPDGCNDPECQGCWQQEYDHRQAT